MSSSSDQEDIELEGAPSGDSSDQSEAEEENQDLAASDTESDEDNNEVEDDDDEVDDDEDVPPPKKQIQPKGDLKMEKVHDLVMEKYKKRIGKQLYIRFPAKLPEDVAEFDKKVKSLSELITEAHKPRQKHARFCLVSFATTEDRDKTLKKLSKTSAETKIVVSLPKTDSEEFVKTIAEKKLKSIEKKRAKLLLKRETKRAATEKKFTPTIVVMNIPKSASVAQVKELFPDSVDVQLKPAPSKFNGASIATITLPSTADARKNVKRKLSLGGTKLIIRFNNENKAKKFQKKNKNKAGGEPPAGPKAPNSAATNGNKQKNKKKKAKKTDGEQAPKVEGPPKAGKKNKASGKQEEQSPSKKAKLENAVPQEPSQKKVKQQPAESQSPAKNGKLAGNLKGNKKATKKQGNAAPNSKGMKANHQNKQKKKALK